MRGASGVAIVHNTLDIALYFIGGRATGGGLSTHPEVVGDKGLVGGDDNVVAAMLRTSAS